MKPILFEIFGIPFPAWYVFFSLGGVLAFLYASYCLKWMTSSSELSGTPNFSAKEEDAFPALFCICYVSGWFGARAFSILREDFAAVGFLGFFESLFSIGSMTFYGGAVVAAVCGVVFAWLKRLRVGLLCDLAIPAGVLGLGVGRVGCFLNGDDFGRPLDILQFEKLPWWAHGIQGTMPWEKYSSLSQSVQIGMNENLFAIVPRYPVQLEEAFFSVALAGVCFFVFRGTYSNALTKKKPLQEKNFLSKARMACFCEGGAGSGSLGLIAVFLSAAHRFFNEFFRGDSRGNFWASSLSTSQGIALILMATTATALGYLLLSKTRACTVSKE